jgi:hypothetical protein
MSEYEHSLRINAAPAEVFRFVADVCSKHYPGGAKQDGHERRKAEMVCFFLHICTAYFRTVDNAAHLPRGDARPLASPTI